MLVLTAFSTLAMMVIMAVQGSSLKTAATPLGIVSLEFAGTVEAAQEVYNAWTPKLLGVAKNHTLIDFCFLISYGCFLFSCSRILARKFQSFARPTGIWISSFSILASIFDAIENILMLRTLSGAIYKEIVASTFMIAACKFLLVAIVLLYIIIALVALILRRKHAVTALH